MYTLSYVIELQLRFFTHTLAIIGIIFTHKTYFQLIIHQNISIRAQYVSRCGFILISRTHLWSCPHTNMHTPVHGCICIYNTIVLSIHSCPTFKFLHAENSLASKWQIVALNNKSRKKIINSKNVTIIFGDDSTLQLDYQTTEAVWPDLNNF